MQWIIRALAIVFGISAGLLGVAALAIGLWLADSEYVHWLDQGIYIHNFTVGGCEVSPYVVSLTLSGMGIALLTLAALAIVGNFTRSPLAGNRKQAH